MKSDKWYKSMRNRTPWNKGVKMSEEHCQKLREAWVERKKTPDPRLGRKLSDEHKENIRKAHIGKTGENASNWKGGITKKDKLERRRFQREVQRKVFERDDYTCQFCGVHGGSLQVDHIQPWAEYVEVRFDMDNCRTLCMTCHYELTFGKEMPEDVNAWGHNLKEVSN